MFIPSPRSFFFTPPAPPHINPLSLHDALPISQALPALAREGLLERLVRQPRVGDRRLAAQGAGRVGADRKSTRLNSSHRCISYAVFCLKKKNKHVLSRMRDLLL